MNNVYKVNSKYIVVFTVAVMLCCITLFSVANYVTSPHFYTPLTNAIDTIPLKLSGKDTIPGNRDTLIRRDSAGNVIRRVDSVDVKISKDSLDAPVSYSASDSMVLDVPSKIITLYSKANVKQKDINLDADKIELDQQKQLMTATIGKDSAGAPTGAPNFVQGDNKMLADTIIFNTKTQKGYTKNTYTQQGEEFFVHADQMKRINATDYFAYHGRFTTCDLDTPHFAFRTQKMKLVNKKLAVSGPIHPEFEGVPIPFYIPFGFFPLSQGRHSGLLPPQFTANDQFGIGLEGLGYYKVLNDYFDVVTRTDLYSYGGYRINITPTYRVRYRYQGSLTFSYQNSRILSDFGKDEFTSTKTFNISWNHSVDSRARPGQTFSASVNAGSTKFNQFVTNNPNRNFQNQLSSSIAYSKNWDNKYNLTVTANHNQNNNTRLVNVNLPTVGFSVSNFYPFQKKEIVGEPKWYEKLGIGLNSNFANQLSFYDSALTFRRLLDTLQWGAQHSVPITLSLPSLGPIQISPGISYRENWYNQRTSRVYDSVHNTVVESSKKGFYRAGDISFSLGFNTAVFGTFDKFSKKSSIVAIRHVMRPSMSLSYNPAIAKGDYYDVQVDSLKHFLRYSYYDRTMFGSLTGQEFGGMSFGLDNNLEMKVRSKKDTTNGGIKKIKILDGFGINGSYNFIADSFKLSTFSLYLRSTLFEKISITAGANLDPYIIDTFGFRRNRLAWQDGKLSLGRLTSGNISISTSFQSKSKDKDKDKDKTKEGESSSAFSQMNQPMTLEEQQAQLQYVRSNPAEFADFNIPWSVNISYSLTFSRDFQLETKNFKTTSSSSVNLSGDFNLTPKWKAGMSTYYDFKGSGLQNVTAFLSREMHCWQMSINIYSGITRGFNITINPKSGFLRDLKINRTRYFYAQ